MTPPPPPEDSAPPLPRAAAGAWLTPGLLSQAVQGGVVLAREDGRIHYASDEARELLGGEETFEQVWAEVARHIFEHRARAADHEAEEDSPGASSPMHLDLPLPGTERPARLRIVYHVLEEEGGFTAVLQDRHSLESLEGALRLALRLKGQSEQIDQAAHDLKAPLHALRLNIDVLRSALDEEGVLDVAEGRLDVLDREVTRLARMVQTTMTRFRLPSDAVRSFEFRRVLREVATLLRPLAQKRRAQLDLKLPDERVTLLGIRDQVKQAVINVAMNGLEAMPGGGRLSLELACRDGQAELSVHDDGAGILPAVAARVFNLYYTTKDDGSGIGLFTSRATLRRMGGDLVLESRPGGGTTARLRIPLQALDQADREQEREGGEAC